MRGMEADRLINPAKVFLSWSGSRGQLEYYDKETKENVPVKLPFRFLVLDEVARVGGYVEEQDGRKRSYYSNAIYPKYAKTADFTVHSSHKEGKNHQIEMTGKWADIKGHVVGAKWVKGLYVAYYGEDDELLLGYIELGGSGQQGWRECLDSASVRNAEVGAFALTKSVDRKKGINTYKAPVFAYKAIVPEKVEAEAENIAKTVLYPYLQKYFAKEVVAAHGDAYEAPGDGYEGSLFTGDPSDEDVPAPTNEEIPW